MNGKKPVALTLIVLCALALAGSALAAMLVDYSLPWQTVTSGGSEAHSAHYALNASLGQTATGLAGSVTYRLSAGFWPGVDTPEVPSGLWLPLVLLTGGE
jgi:hypothetical protein